MSDIKKNNTIDAIVSDKEKMINDLYDKFKGNPLNIEIKKHGLSHLLDKEKLDKLEKKIPNFKEYIEALKKKNIVVVMMGENGLPDTFIDRRYTALVRFMKGISDKKFIIINEQNNARVAGLLEEAWHLKNPRGTVKKGEVFDNKYELLNYIKVELESAIFGNTVAEIIFNEKRDFIDILNEVIDVELMPHYKFKGNIKKKRESLLKIIFEEYKIEELEQLIVKIKNKNIIK